MEKENEVTEMVKNEAAMPAMPAMPQMGELLFDDAKFSRINDLANMMASGRCAVPKHLQNNPGDCFAIIIQATQWRMNPFVVAQKTHIVNGALGYEAQLINAVITSMNVTSDRFHYEYVGDWDGYRASLFAKDKELGCGVLVGATLRGETEIRWLPTPLCMEQVKTRNSPLWATNPQQQLAYLAVKYWVRLYAPDAILGVYSDDELADNPGMKNVTPEPEPAPAPEVKKAKTAKLKEKLGVVDAEEVKPLSTRIKETIDKLKAPVTVAEVEDNLRSKGLLDGYKLDDIERYPSEWRKYLLGDLTELVNESAQRSCDGSLV